MSEENTISGFQITEVESPGNRKKQNKKKKKSKKKKEVRAIEKEITQTVNVDPESEKNLVKEPSVKTFEKTMDISAKNENELSEPTGANLAHVEQQSGEKEQILPSESVTSNLNAETSQVVSPYSQVGIITDLSPQEAIVSNSPSTICQKFVSFKAYSCSDIPHIIQPSDQSMPTLEAPVHFNSTPDLRKFFRKEKATKESHLKLLNELAKFANKYDVSLLVAQPRKR